MPFVVYSYCAIRKHITFFLWTCHLLPGTHWKLRWYCTVYWLLSSP